MDSRATSLLTLLAVASGLSAACSTSEQRSSTSPEEVVDGYSPYPFEMREIRAVTPFDPANASIADFGSAARNQGELASCASHGFLGLVENQLFNDKGVRVDLSERFQLYANFMASGNMGTAPKVIARFPSIVERWGLLHEETYPYAMIAGNASRFAKDAAQGLTNDPNAVTVDDAIAGTADASGERSAVLQRGEFLGALPAGPYPIELPVKAALAAGADPSELEFEGRYYRCFDEDPASVPSEDRLRVTPREFAHACLGIDPKSYFSCEFDELSAIDAAATAATGDDCSRLRTGLERAAFAQATSAVEWLKLTTSLLDRGQATMVAVTSPANQGPSPVWRANGNVPGGGHAVLALGYVTYAELQQVEQQGRGLLGAGIFDRLAGAVEPEYQAKVDAGALPTDPAALRDARLATKVAKAIANEGGLVLFRNSWGTVHPGAEMPIGIDGYQSMTFEFFLRSVMLVQSRANKNVQGVSWDFSAGPAYCPASAVPSGDPWFGANHGARLAPEFVAQMQAKYLPPQCRP